MKNTTDLTTGPIFSALVKLSFPIIGTSFIQMAYNLTDVLWLGRTGSTTVTAVTTAGFFLWLLMAAFYCTKSGTETLVAQSVGRKDAVMARKVVENALAVSFVGSATASILLFAFAPQLLGFFKLEEMVMAQAVSYLRIVSFGTCFAAMNPVLSAAYIGHGNSRTPFLINSLGLVVNIVLDPLLIFGLFFLPELGAEGAALATVVANTIVFTVFLFKLKGTKSPLDRITLFTRPIVSIVKKILRIGLPISASSVAFCLFSMYIGRIVSAYGTIPLGVQNVGASIEALSWNTAIGFSTALSSFTGQNFGAGTFERIKKGYFCVLSLSLVLGLVATVAFVFYGAEIFSLFSTEQEMIETGALYLKILAVSQIFMCIEITSAGGFYGLGKTKVPAFISIFFTGLRIPAALSVVALTTYTYDGVWWCVSISSVFKGIIVMGMYVFTLKKILQKRAEAS